MSNSPFTYFFVKNTLYIFVVYTKKPNYKKYYLGEVDFKQSNAYRLLLQLFCGLSFHLI